MEGGGIGHRGGIVAPPLPYIVGLLKITNVHFHLFSFDFHFGKEKAQILICITLLIPLKFSAPRYASLATCFSCEHHNSFSSAPINDPLLLLSWPSIPLNS